MSFFILTGAILLGTVFIVHYAANALGFRLFYLSLFLSAVFALSINLIVISMKEVTSPLSIAKILLAVLLASAFVTVINEVLTGREKKKLQAKRKKTKEAKREAKEENSDTDEDKTVPPKEGFFKKLFKKFSFSGSKRKKSEIAEEDSFKEEILDEEVPEEIFEDVSKDEIPKDVAEEKASEDAPKKESFIKKLFKKEEQPKREKPDFSEFQDLDAILDYADEAKISGDYGNAAAAYEWAAEKYADDPYLPFLFIDLGNAHKAQGEYNAAIDVYEKAVNMPAIKKDAGTVKSFEENITYLKALKIVLRKHKIEHRPFAEIDEDILREVEERLDNK